jgi:hypothetical protein
MHIYVINILLIVLVVGLYIPPSLTISNAAFSIYRFHVNLSVNRDCFLKECLSIDLCNAEVRCFFLVWS